MRPIDKSFVHGSRDAAQLRVLEKSTQRGRAFTARGLQSRSRMKYLAVLTLLAACSSSSDLDEDAVTSIPPGTGTGTAMTGTYRMASVTTDCSGDCTTSFDGAIYSACDIGTRLEDTVTITQTDGKLKMDVDNSDYVSRLEGGVDDDGTFEVGGVRTQLGGQVTITARTLGTFAGSAVTGTARLRVSGRGLGCHIEADVDGARR